MVATCENEDLKHLIGLNLTGDPKRVVEEFDALWEEQQDSLNEFTELGQLALQIGTSAALDSGDLEYALELSDGCSSLTFCNQTS